MGASSSSRQTRQVITGGPSVSGSATTPEWARPLATQSGTVATARPATTTWSPCSAPVTSPVPSGGRPRCSSSVQNARHCGRRFGPPGNGSSSTSATDNVYCPQARHRPVSVDGYGHVKNASNHLGDATELCDLVQYCDGPVLDHRVTVHSGVQGGGEHDRSGVRIRVSQLTDEVCPDPSGSPRSRSTRSAVASTPRASPSDATSPTISKSGSVRNSKATASRTVALSSTSRTRTGFGISARCIAERRLQAHPGAVSHGQAPHAPSIQHQAARRGSVVSSGSV